jgi:DNA-binding winged helix-turn-helix (wHTH) protein
VSASFGSFTLDRPRRQVRRGDEQVHLTRKAFDLLVVLVDEAPRVVTKAELHERLWPGTFVSDSALVALVKELRRVVREPGATDSYIATTHGVGYAFTADLQAASAVPTPTGVVHWIVVGERRITLGEGENVIGRDPSSHVWLDVAGVSRRHARIVVRGTAAVLEDMGSKNGTAARALPVTGAVPLRDGDDLDVGPVSIRYRSSAAGMSTETVI